MKGACCITGRLQYSSSSSSSKALERSCWVKTEQAMIFVACRLTKVNMHTRNWAADAQHSTHAYLLCQVPAVQSAAPAGAALQPLSDERACSRRGWTSCLCLLLCSPQTSGSYLVLAPRSAPIHRPVLSLRM